MTDERWRSPLSTRYASPAMQTLWGEPRRIGGIVRRGRWYLRLLTLRDAFARPFSSAKTAPPATD